MSERRLFTVSCNSGSHGVTIQKVVSFSALHVSKKEMTITLRTSQGTHHVSATKTNQETVADYCEDHTEHINTFLRFFIC
jgi:DNA-directed RNA polymerase subunit L